MRTIEEVLCRHKSVTELIAELRREEKELNSEIVDIFSHNIDGQKSYRIDNWNVEIKTAYTYTVDKKSYESSPFFNDNKSPVKCTKSYTIDKRKFVNLMINGDENTRNYLDGFIRKYAPTPKVTLTKFENEL